MGGELNIFERRVIMIFEDIRDIRVLKFHLPLRVSHEKNDTAPSLKNKKGTKFSYQKKKKKKRYNLNEGLQCTSK